ncbi:SigE family RNA polymerase sigma factor, partial [Streptomyces sp. NPDC048473]
MKSAQEDQYLEFVAARAKALYRSAYVLAAGDTHLAEDLV